jgi:CheY-like chemotaxis protein/HPt (histidine-containing phosphotransfer) domain-containing protein
MEMIHNSGMTLLGLVNDILDISKIESGKFELHPIEYDVPSIINDITVLNIMHTNDKPIKFNIRINENLPAVLFGDDLRVKRIFNNLLSNAFKYTESGSVNWNIDFEIDGDSVWIISDVIDTGIGIKPEDKAKLFEDYNQVDAQANRGIEGTGLGLSIMKNLLGMMDGTILVESEYGKGSKFSIRFRQGFVSDVVIGKKMADNLMSDRYAASRLAQRANIVRIDLSYAHVLVVDDMNTNLDVVKGMLKPYKLKIDCATSGSEAIELIRAENPRYDAVFMDHMMPVMDGVEATHIIREELDTDYARNIPIIALTANAIVGSEQMFLENGFQDFISKPIDILLLDSALRKWVRDKTREERPTDDTLGGAEATVANDSQSRVENLVIEDVDVRAGLVNFNGDIDLYSNVLHSFVKNTRLLVDGIENYLAEGDLQTYIIDMHGIKGSSYSVFATQLGDKARRLENLAKAGEEATVKAENSDFVAYANSTLDRIESALETFKATCEKPYAPYPDKELLSALREACGKYDIREVNSTLQLLESFEYGEGLELVEWLREQVDNMNFDEIYNGNWEEALG